MHDYNKVQDKISASFLGFDGDYIITGTPEEQAALLAELEKTQRIEPEMIDQLLESGTITEEEAKKFHAEWDD